MTPAEALGRRAMACRGFRWIAGMAGISDALEQAGYRRLRVAYADYDDEYKTGMVIGWSASNEAFGDWNPAQFDIVPDFRDPATPGLLPMLVREAFGCPTMVAIQDSLGSVGNERIPGLWYVTSGLTGPASSHNFGLDGVLFERMGSLMRFDPSNGRPTEIEAWIAAWEAA